MHGRGDRLQYSLLLHACMLHRRVLCVGLTLILAVFEIDEQGPGLCCSAAVIRKRVMISAR